MVERSSRRRDSLVGIALVGVVLGVATPARTASDVSTSSEEVAATDTPVEEPSSDEQDSPEPPEHVGEQTNERSSEEERSEQELEDSGSKTEEEVIDSEPTGVGTDDPAQGRSESDEAAPDEVKDESPVHAEHASKSAQSSSEQPGREGDDGGGDGPSATGPAVEPAPIPSSPEQDEPQRFFVVPNIALAVGGWTDVEVTCETSGSLSCVDEEISGHSDVTRLGVGVDAIYRPAPYLGLVGMLFWDPASRGRSELELRHLGMEVALQGALEGMLYRSKFLSLALRVHGGGVVLVPQGWVNQQLDQAEADCDEAIGAGISCQASRPALVSPTWGVSLGLVAAAGPGHLRLDTRFQSQLFRIVDQHAENATGSIDAHIKLKQSRVWLALGYEL